MDSFHGFMCLFNLSFCVSVLLLETSLNKHVDLKRKLNIRFHRQKGIQATKEEYFNIFQQSGYGWMTMATFPPSWVFSTLPSFIEFHGGKIFSERTILNGKNNGSPVDCPLGQCMESTSRFTVAFHGTFKWQRDLRGPWKLELFTGSGRFNIAMGQNHHFYLGKFQKSW